MRRLVIAAALLVPALALAQNIVQQSPTTFSGTDFVRSGGVISLAAPGGGSSGGITTLTGDCTATGIGIVPITCNFPSGLTSSSTDPTISGDLNDRWLAKFFVNYDSSLNLNSGYTNASGVEIIENADFGLNSYAGGTNAKWTFLPLSVSANYRAHGQRFLLGLGMNCWGNGDCFGETKSIGFWGADINGDEGQGFQAVSYLSQGGRDNNPYLTRTTLSAASVATTCNTTATQAITGSQTVQTVTVAATTGCAVNDWVVVNGKAPTAQPNYEAVKITAVGTGTISGVFRLNQSSGVTIKPAKVVTVADTSDFGQGRLLVNLTAAGYSTGTVSSISGGGFTGSGTTWTTSMVGDNGQPNIGCIALTADDYSGSPFDGTGRRSTLKSWYAILPPVTAIGLAVFTTSVANDAAYHGYGPGAGGYQIKPCAEVLQVVGNTVILMTTAAAWNSGDTVEEAITPFPDVSGHMEHYAVYTAGGALRSAYSFRNTGRRMISAGINIDANMPSGADPNGWDNGINLSGVRTGLDIRSSSLGIRFADNANNNTDIVWGPTDPTSTNRDKAIGYSNFNGSGALMLHSAGGTGRCADGGSMCLGLQNSGSSQYWSNYNGWLSLYNNHNGGKETRLRFYDSATVASDPATATRYADIVFVYSGSAYGNWDGLAITNGTTELLKLDIGNRQVTVTGDQINTGKTSATKQVATNTFLVGGLSVVTATGADINGAPDLTKQTNIVTSGAAGTGVLLLPTTYGDLANATGLWVDVYNDGPANPIRVYAAGGSTIDGAAGTTGVPLTNGFWARFIATAPGVWKSYRFAIARSS